GTPRSSWQKTPRRGHRRSSSRYPARSAESPERRRRWPASAGPPVSCGLSRSRRPSPRYTQLSLQQALPEERLSDSKVRLSTYILYSRSRLTLPGDVCATLTAAELPPAGSGYPAAAPPPCDLSAWRRH